MTEYFVLNGHTLGYMTDKQPGLFAPLAGKPQLGGLDPLNGPIYISPCDNLKAARLPDFEYFRVDPKGHIL